MKKLILVASLLVGVSAFSQAKIDPTKLNYMPVDVSPMDAVYYPLQVTSSKTETPKVKLEYSRPQKKTELFLETLLSTEKSGDLERMKLLKSNSIRL